MPKALVLASRKAWRDVERWVAWHQAWGGAPKEFGFLLASVLSAPTLKGLYHPHRKGAPQSLKGMQRLASRL